jgi:hypothetical protein
MKYEKPEVNALIPAINAIQSSSIEVNKRGDGLDSHSKEGHTTFADWED